MMEFGEIVVKESPGLCRCCLSEGCYKDLGSEYAWMNDTEIYADMLLECFDIGISQHNEGPNGPNRLICEVCITRLRDACNFKKQVVDSEKKFVDMVGRGEFGPKVVIYQTTMKSEQGLEEPHSQELEVEYLDEDMQFDDADDQPLSHIEAEPSGSEDVALHTVKVKGKRGRPKKTAVKTEKKPKMVHLEEKPRSSRAVTKGAKLNTEELKRKKMEESRKLLIKRRNVEYVLLYSNATPFVWCKGKFACFYCSEHIQDPVALRDHTARVHQFANLELVVNDRIKNNRDKDAAIKIDVTDLICSLCPEQVIVPNLEQLLHHLIITHDAEYDMSVPNCMLPFKLDKNEPTCGTCNMKFGFFEYLLRHANKHHLSHDYMCDTCGTSFQGENHLRMHQRYYHKEGGHSCRYCGQILATLSKRLVHEKNAHLARLLTCPHCPDTFKSTYNKKLHLANVHGVAELQIKCPYCPKVFPQESIMSRHMRRVHLREKNVECEVCKEKFFGNYDLKLHMVRHSGNKMFTCEYCSRKFSKKGNLISHIIIHTGEKKYICEICKKPYGHLQNLKFHIKNQHRVIKDLEGIVDDEEGDIIQLEFIGDELEGTELTGQYVQ